MPLLPWAGSQHHGFMRVPPATRGSCATGKQLPVALDRGTAQAAVLYPLCFLCKKSQAVFSQGTGPRKTSPVWGTSSSKAVQASPIHPYSLYFRIYHIY